MKLYEKLNNIQSSLKVAKDQFNAFGKYKYRSCEDILEAVKPLLKEYKCILTISDVIKNIGERYYVEATATLTDIEDGTQISVSASAREDESKKGMDSSQLTGSTSSYARKYSLNGLFAIDDTKDADTTNEHDKTAIKDTITEAQRKELISKANNDIKKLKEVCLKYTYTSSEQIKKVDFEKILKDLEE